MLIEKLLCESSDQLGVQSISSKKKYKTERKQVDKKIVILYRSKMTRTQLEG